MKLLVWVSSKVGINAEAVRNLTEPLISCPQKRAGVDQNRGYEVNVGYADSQTV